MNPFRWLLKALPSRTFEGTGGPYLTRYRVYRGERFGVFLHEFHRGDEDPEHHNHPWMWGLALLLWGGYVEHRLRPNGTVRRRTFYPGMLNFIRRVTYHRVDLRKKKSWSLFFVGPKVDEWGFLHPVTKTYTHWETFVRRKGLKPI